MAEPDGSVGGDVEARLRSDARRIVDAAIRSVRPDELVRDALSSDPLELPADGRLFVLAVGKAASLMARGAGQVLGDRVSSGLVLTVDGAGGEPPGAFRVRRGGHPLPDERSVAAAREAKELVAGARGQDRVLLLLSGGASALLALPAGDVTLSALRDVTDALLRSGADIGELNTVRRHLEVLKGGGLARVAEPALVRALVLSDVVGDDPALVGSGPASSDPSTAADAIAVLEGRGLWRHAPAPVRGRLLDAREARGGDETGGDGPFLREPRVSLVGNVGLAVEGAADAARRLGYAVEVLAVGVTGEARQAGAALARRASRAEAPRFLVQGGETTVTVVGDGAGGPNQEMALGAALELDGLEGILVFSVGTDGVDGPTEAAGAMASGRTVARARARGLEPEESLARNDSHRLFRALDDLIVTGPTGTNVMDVSGGLVLPPAAGRR